MTGNFPGNTVKLDYIFKLSGDKIGFARNQAVTLQLTAKLKLRANARYPDIGR